MVSNPQYNSHPIATGFFIALGVLAEVGLSCYVLYEAKRDLTETPEQRHLEAFTKVKHYLETRESFQNRIRLIADGKVIGRNGKQLALDQLNTRQLEDIVDFYESTGGYRFSSVSVSK